MKYECKEQRYAKISMVISIQMNSLENFIVFRSVKQWPMTEPLESFARGQNDKIKLYYVN